eukprot:2858086-Prymnesium_polylepis.1
MRFTRYTFDWKAAHREIARTMQSLCPQEAVQVQGEWVVIGGALGTPTSSNGADGSGRTSMLLTTYGGLGLVGSGVIR